MQPHQHPSLGTLEMAGKLSREGSTQGRWENLPSNCSNLLVSRE